MQTAQPPIPPFNHHPIMLLPSIYQVRDFTQAITPALLPFSVGKYNEDRRGMYTHDLFTSDHGQRSIHMGIDLGAPIDTPLYAFNDGIIYDFSYRSDPGDYGHVLITQHHFRDQDLWCLYGHLSAASIKDLYKQKSIKKGECIAYIGAEHENGNWPPHVHFQISFKKPIDCDMQGVVTQQQHAQALLDFPDPQIILGRLYLD